MSIKNASRNSKTTPNTIIRVRIQPRANKNEIIEIMADGKVKIRLTAPPVGGRANYELIKFLGKVLGIAPSNLEIVSGFKSREKLVTISNIDLQSIHKRLRKFISVE